ARLQHQCRYFGVGPGTINVGHDGLGFYRHRRNGLSPEVEANIDGGLTVRAGALPPRPPLAAGGDANDADAGVSGRGEKHAAVDRHVADFGGG
ncbi:MAG TPA: hypothetical protein VGF57_10785, partial [Roseiarcus sp.]